MKAPISIITVSYKVNNRIGFKEIRNEQQ